jgi:hypothetical protein
MPDLRTNAPNTDYFFLGDGRIMAIIQWSREPDMSPYGVLIFDPERMSRKNGALMFHPELGLARTMLTVTIDGVRYNARQETTQATWDLEGSAAAVLVRWKAGPVEVIESFSVQPSTSHLIRDVMISSPEPCQVEVEAALYGNPLFFDEFGVRPGGVLYATGYSSINLYAIPSGRAFERFVTVPGESAHDAILATFVYTIEAVGTHEFSLYPQNMEVAAYPEHAAPASRLGRSFGAALEQSGQEKHPPSLAARIAELYRISRKSMRAAVSQLGKFDASIWQYDFEWGMDAAMVATAAASSGLFPLAYQLLGNILHRLSNADGMIAESSRFRGGEMAELNGNGSVLDALWHYWHWSGDASLMKGNWKRISAIADYPLRQEFQHPSGLLKTRRDFWERLPWMGIAEGFELGHQVYCTVGLRRAAEMAEAVGDDAAAGRWREASERIYDAMLNDPKFSLVEDGHFIHRRLVDGSVQTALQPDYDYSHPEYISYLPRTFEGGTQPKPCEPDITEALPIVYGLVDPRSDLALVTLDRLCSLWNPNGYGGYARYNIASDPDSPGAWAFATAFMAAAEIEAELGERSCETIEWLLEAAGAGGCWFEYYGERKTPPFPPVGVIVWGWAQYILLVVKHIVGVRVAEKEIRITPKFIGIEHTVRFGAHTIRVTVEGYNAATLDGNPLKLDGRTACISLPLEADHVLEFR